MGVKKKTIKEDWSEKRIQEYTSEFLLSRGSKKYEMCNLYVFDWESDYLAITKNGYIYECEIKISRSDFFNDKKKERKHLILEGKVDQNRPHYFYYVVPKGLVEAEEVPPYAGLIYVNDDFREGPYWDIIKKAPKMHDEKYTLQDTLRLTDKFYWNMVTNKAKADQYNQLLMENKHLQKELFNYDAMLSEKQQEIDDLQRKLLLLESK